MNFALQNYMARAGLNEDWEPQWSVHSIADVPKYGDIRDRWHPEIDPMNKLAVYDTTEIFHKPKYIGGFYTTLRTKKDEKAVTLMDVTITDLWPTQPFVDVGGLDRKVQGHGNHEPPLVVRWTDGRLFVTDHTRTAATLVKGHHKIKAKVVASDDRGKLRKLTPEEIKEIK